MPNPGIDDHKGSGASVHAEALEALDLLPEADQAKVLDYIKELANFSKENGLNKSSILKQSS